MFRHPVGIFPAAARWYLATLAMIVLLGIAAHLSIQMHAQQRAQQMIQQWGQEARVTIGDVRYHLLRNGLILQDIHIKRGNDSMHIEHLLVRADPSLLTSHTPRIGKVELSGLQANIQSPGKSLNWQDDQHLNRIWQATTSLSIRDGNIKLYLADSDAPPLELANISLRQRVLSSIRHINGHSQIHGGTVNWQWQIGEHQSTPGQGVVNWQHVDAAALTGSLGLKQSAGNVSGQFSWQSSQAGSARAGSNTQIDPNTQADRNTQTDPLAVTAMQASMQLNTASNTETADLHHLQLSATKSSGQWKADVQARAWPLQSWSDMLPTIVGRKLISAQMDGSSQWSAQADSWTITSDEGLLKNVTFADPAGSFPDWHWKRIQYTDASMHMEKKRLQLATLNMTSARLILNPDLDTNTAASIDPATASAQKNWGISADRITVDDLTLTLAMPQGNISLTELAGTCQWPRWGPLSFKLRTTRPPTSEGDIQHNRARWSLRGTAKRGKKSQLSSASMRLRGSHIPASRLRPLLPLQDDTNRPVKLAGDIDLKTEITVEYGLWQMRGKASALELNLSRGGENWLLKELSTRFGPVGMGLESQRINKLDIEGWHYIAALHPLPPVIPHAADSQPDQPDSPAWWVSSLRNQHVEIDNIQFSDGTISVGNAQAIWADHVNLQLDTIKPGHWANINLQGKSGGGRLNIKGKWDILSDTQRFYGIADLSQATPFFLHDWMRASGLPVLIRGRLSAHLIVSESKTPDFYQSSLKTSLIQGLVESDAAATDPMLARTGYNTPTLLQRLDDGAGRITVQSANEGSWLSQPLTLEALGLSLQSAMHQKALEWQPHESGATQTLSEPIFETQVRLHGRKLLSQNERSRIFKVVKKLRQQPNLIVELKPQWMGDTLSLDTLRRIQRTQQLIEKYMTYRNIDPSRILPVWPTPADQTNDVGFIQIVTRTAG